MKKQYVVFGANVFGHSVARALEAEGNQVILVDRDPDKIQDAGNEVTYAVAADVTDREAINTLGLSEMDGAVICMSDCMEANIVAAMMCKELGIKMIIARAKNEIHGKILKKIGVTRVVFPEVEMGTRIGRFLSAKGFADWIELSTDYSLVELEVPQDWIGKSLAQLNVRGKYGLNVIGMRRNGEMQMQFLPTDILEKKTMLFVVGKNQDLEKFQN